VPVPYTISETNDGRYIVQRPNGIGGLYPLTMYQDDVRSTRECFATIAADALDTGALYEGVHIEFRPKHHPANDFTRR
jgi:hypothetical protein